MNFEHIKVEINACLATLWLNRPEVHNALNKKMLSEIINCIEALNKQEEIRLIVLRGKGKTFCSGADIHEMQQAATDDIEVNQAHSLLLAQCFQTLHESTKPVLAWVHGGVYAGGLGLVCACDIAFITSETWFSIPEAGIGLVPATILPYLLKRITPQNAKVLIYTGLKIDADSALEMGLLDFTFMEEKGKEKVNKLINRLLKASPHALAETKKLLTLCQHETISNILINKTIQTLSRVKASPEGIEGLTAFLEKRTPNWVQKIN